MSTTVASHSRVGLWPGRSPIRAIQVAEGRLELFGQRLAAPRAV